MERRSYCSSQASARERSSKPAAWRQSSICRGSGRIEPHEAGAVPVIDYPYQAVEADLCRHREGVRLIARLLAVPGLAQLVERNSRPSDEIMHEDRALKRWILENIQTAHHPMGTATMAAESDPRCVVTPGLCVKGTERLHVADASILSGPIRANTHLAVLAVAHNAVGIPGCEAMKSARAA